MIEKKSFSKCCDLTSVQFSDDIKLYSIEKKSISLHINWKLLHSIKSWKIWRRSFIHLLSILVNVLFEVDFTIDSELQTIESFAFANSKLEKKIKVPSFSRLWKHHKSWIFRRFKSFVNISINRIFIPSKVKELEEWLSQNTLNLNVISVSSENKLFQLFIIVK